MSKNIFKSSWKNRTKWQVHFGAKKSLKSKHRKVFRKFVGNVYYEKTVHEFQLFKEWIRERVGRCHPGRMYKAGKGTEVGESIANTFT